MNTSPVIPRDSPDGRKTAEPRMGEASGKRNASPLFASFAAALCMSVMVFLLETLKQTFFPQIHIWQSHAVTITFSGVIAAVTAWLVFRVNERAKERLRQLSRAVEQSPLTIVITNLAGEIEYVNPHFTETTGYSAAEARGQNPRILKSGETPPEEYAHLWQTITSGKDWHGEFHNRRKNGELYWELAAISPIFDEAGKITHFLAFKEDITERKKMDQQLVETLDFNRKIITDVPAGIVVYKASGECVVANEAAAQIIQATVPQILKQDFRQLESWRDSGLLEAAEKTLATKDPQGGEFRFVSTFGKEVWVVGNFSCFVRNNEPHLLLTLNDITERKEAEQTIANERALLRTLVDHLPVAIYLKDLAGRKTLANPVELSYAGVTSETEILGKTDSDLFPPEEAAAYRADDQKVLDSGNAVINREGSFTKPDGSVIWFLTSKVPLCDATGRVTGLAGINLDITERKQVEGTLLRTQRALQTISDCNQALVRATTEPALLQEICRVIVKEGGYRFAWVGFAKHDEQRTVQPAAHAGYEEGYLEKLSLTWADAERGGTPTGRAIRTGQPAVCRDFRTDPTVAPWRDEAIKRGYISSITLPLLTDGKTFGILNIYSSDANAFDAREAKLLAELADDLAYGIQALRARTERQQIEETLANERKLLRTLLDNIPDKIYFKDRDSRFIRVNPALGRHVGLNDPAEAIGKTDFDFFSEEHARQAYEDEQAIIRSGKPLVGKEEKETWLGGRVGWVSTTKMPLWNPEGQVVGTFGISRDITERKRTEEQIRDQARLLDLAPEAILVRDLEDRVRYWNKSAERIYGWTAQEAIGKKVGRLLHKDFSNGAKYEAAWKAVLEKGDWQGEFTLRTKSGQEVIEETRWTLVRDPQGIPKSILTISADITEKKKLEAQFLRAQRMENIGAVAGGIAHDLNNVLTPLLVAVQLLKGKINDADGQKLLNALETNVERGAKLVKQVLTFGRGVQGERIPVQPAYIIREIKQIIQETFPKSVEFECDSPAGLWTITGDSTQLYQVLLNLAVNARDAMPNGGKLSFRLENVVLDEAYSRMNLGSKPGPYVVFEVTDTGTGIPKEIHDRIFDPFFTTKDPGHGTGLGLSTTLGIVKSHGGFIHCYSEPGKGSTFKVYLPANAAPKAAENAATEQIKLPRGRNELVLVVDDEEPIRAVAQKTLECFGYRVLLAANGVEAASLYSSRRNEIAAVITDMAMPVMDGPATIVALRSINPEVKIIGSSGFGSKYAAPRANGAETEHFIRKPYSTEAMLHALHQVLHGSAAN